MKKPILITRNYIVYDFYESGNPKKAVNLEKFFEGVLITLLLLSTIFTLGVLWYTRDVNTLNYASEIVAAINQKGLS